LEEIIMFLAALWLALASLPALSWNLFADAQMLLSVAAAAQVMGVLLIFALLVTPAAVAERLTTRPPLAIALSVAFSLLFTWGGLAVAFYTPYPVSFFITSLAFGTYVVVRLVPIIGFLVARVRTRLAPSPVVTEQISLVAFPKQEVR
jgi:ABC-type Mn2+/Zn2+ transport system permease subunit